MDNDGLCKLVEWRWMLSIRNIIYERTFDYELNFDEGSRSYTKKYISLKDKHVNTYEYMQLVLSLEVNIQYLTHCYDMYLSSR